MSLEFSFYLHRRDFNLKLAGHFGNETIGIFGPSGAGKSSFFHVLAGLEKPESGRIIVNGKILTDSEKGIHIAIHKRKIALVFQDKLLFPHLTIRQNIVFGERYAGNKRIGLEEISTLLGLNPLLESMPRDISGGEQQRAAIARALLASPDLLLLDEPFNGMDNALRMAVLPYLRRLRDELEIPFLVISHDLPDIQRLTDKVYFINKGKCEGFGSPFDYYGEKLTRDSGFINCFRLHKKKDLSSGLCLCTVNNTSLELLVPCFPESFRSLVVSPRAVILARHKVEGISVRNQIPARVIRVIRAQGHALCLLDAGFPIAAQLTICSLEELKIQEGDHLYCLIKAMAFRF